MGLVMILLVILQLLGAATGDENTTTITTTVSSTVKTTSTSTSVDLPAEAAPSLGAAMPNNCTASSNDTVCEELSLLSRLNSFLEGYLGVNYKIYEMAFMVIVSATVLMVIYFVIKMCM